VGAQAGRVLLEEASGVVRKQVDDAGLGAPKRKERGWTDGENREREREREEVERGRESGEKRRRNSASLRLSLSSSLLTS